MRVFIFVVAALHAAFMAGELFPFGSPFLLRKLSAKLPKGLGTELPQGQGTVLPKDKAWTESQEKLVAVIVRNAGVYNGILAGGLIWAALPQTPDREVARVLLAGAAAAGIFGSLTLKSPLTAAQALLGIIGLAFI
jgi:hypothetical protein